MATQRDYSRFKKIHVNDDWFEVYQVKDNLFVFFEPRHYEETLVNMLIGPEKAVLIDTGCGIGDLNRVVKKVTDQGVMVINTHTHADHLGSNHQFEEIALFDHPLSRQVAAEGIHDLVLQSELLDESLVDGAFPSDFNPGHFKIPPFKVDHWLKDGGKLNAGGVHLEVIHTPGESVNHICLLDKVNRVLFCGDILLEGAVWTHLEGGNLQELIKSYRKLMHYFDDFDHLMPGHNLPLISKDLLPQTLTAAEKVASGEASYHGFTDPWKRKLKRYAFNRFSIITS